MTATNKLSRLDKLIILISTGSSASVKNAAANMFQPLAAKLMEDQSYVGVLPMIDRILPLLKNTSWDTRTAASNALGGVLQATGEWTPAITTSEEFPPFPESDALDGFDVVQLLGPGGSSRLLASSGVEYSKGKIDPTSSNQEALSHMGEFADIGLDLHILSEGEGKEIKTPLTQSRATKVEDDAQDDVAMAGLSARERNKLKRKRKSEAKSGKPNQHDILPKIEPEGTIDAKPTAMDIVDNQDSSVSQVERFEKLTSGKPGQNPYDAVADNLLIGLESPNWEERHGSSLAMSKLIQIQGKSLGKFDGAPIELNNALNRVYLSRTCKALLSLLALDRFTDYQSDLTVSPVRETAAQTYASALDLLDAEQLKRNLFVLSAMSSYFGEWQVRHAGLLGMRYLVRVREDAIGDPTLSARIVTSTLAGLGDKDDDVRSASAVTLLHLVKSDANSCRQINSIQADNIITMLWDSLLELKDDLCASTSAVIELLVLMSDLRRQGTWPDIPIIAPVTHIDRIFPFVRHPNSSVRVSVMRAFESFILDGLVTQQMLQYIFQNILLDTDLNVGDNSKAAWVSALVQLKKSGNFEDILIPHIASWFDLLMTPLGQKMNVQLLPVMSGVFSHKIDKPMLNQDFAVIEKDTIILSRMSACSAISTLMAYWPETTAEQIFTPFLAHYYLDTNIAWQQFSFGMILSNFLDTPSANHLLFEFALERSNSFLSDSYRDEYKEVKDTSNALYIACKSLLHAFAEDGQVQTAAIPPFPTSLNFKKADAENLASGVFERLVPLVPKPSRKRAGPVLQNRVATVKNLIDQYENAVKSSATRAQASAAGAVARAKVLPSKIGDVIRKLMESIRLETIVTIQTASCASMAIFAQKVLQAGKTEPCDKIVKNLCTLLCEDSARIPIYALNKHSEEIWRPSEADLDRPSSISSIGALTALKSMIAIFEGETFIRLKRLFDLIESPILTFFSKNSQVIQMKELDSDIGQGIVDSFAILWYLQDALSSHTHLLQQILDLVPNISQALNCPVGIVRFAAAQAYSQFCNTLNFRIVEDVVNNILPRLSSENIYERRGVTQVIAMIVTKLDLRVLPILSFFIVPVLGRMSDSDSFIREMASVCFAHLVKVMPLEIGTEDAPFLSPELLLRRKQERKFVSQLLDPSKMEPFKIPVEIAVELRPYQRSGVNWMTFLAKYQLHGILCDDMGLGKTLQTICVLASQHHQRNGEGKSHIPSLVVCPPTLVSHWQHEISHYVSNIKPFIYNSSGEQTKEIANNFSGCDIVICSYDTVRKDATLSQHQFLYCVADEGHILKNSKTKVAAAMKRIRCHNRLILSGTPIQNNVGELWNLFDFLMPGFLGSEKDFQRKYGRPIAAYKDAKTSLSAQKAGRDALESLHKQVLPFLLRRLKEDVLKDLPPKIIQDFFCEPSDLQKRLYDRFGAQQLESNDVEELKSRNAFQSLNYLRKLCNHPALVLDEPTKEELEIIADCVTEDRPLKDARNAPKLVALQQLLWDCGIDANREANGAVNLSHEESLSQHRVLIFFQMKKMLEIVAKDLFDNLMPGVSYLKLDGTVEPSKRGEIVRTFNDDPSIDVLLLTTQIGGLGLTLTGADTVIFVEHDWNPMKDLQAMDRAHRLGQKKVVNVYRLLTRGTLEEKILGMQRFKLNVANTVVSQQNSGLDNLESDQVLDLFSVSTGGSVTKTNSKSTTGLGEKILRDIAEERDIGYGNEYEDLNVEAFMFRENQK